MLRFITFFILYNIIILNLYSQGCELPQGCEDKEFPYKFCNSNNLLYKCSKNPYNEWDGTTQLKPMKLDGCFKFDHTSYTVLKKTEIWLLPALHTHFDIIEYDEVGNPIYGHKFGMIPIYYPGTNTEITGYNDGDPIHIPYETHLEMKFKDIWLNETFKDSGDNIYFNWLKYISSDYPGTNTNFDEALALWKSNCFGCELNNQDIQLCCVTISWTNDPQKFLKRGFEPSVIPAYSSSAMAPPSSEPCNFECDKLTITLNQTDEFTGNTKEEPGNYTKHFFITGTTRKSGWYSLKATLMHEMAHHFGFGDQYEGDLLNCDHTGSIMDGRDFENPDRTLSDDDKCMYMKMYCWSPPNGIEENLKTLKGIIIFPNPTNSNVINIILSNTLEIDMDFEIISSNGSLVKFGNIKSNENPKTIILENFATGDYYIILKHNGIQELKKFIIKK